MNWDINKFINILSSQIVEVIDYHRVVGKTFSGISYDSRDIYVDEVFLAIDGKTSGIDYLEMVYRQGVALYIISQKHQEQIKSIDSGHGDYQSTFIIVKDTVYSYGRLAKAALASVKGKKIAIVGSAGKTLLKEYLSQVLSTKYLVFSSKKNFNNHIGLPKNIFKLIREQISRISKTSKTSKQTKKIFFDYLIFELGMNHAGEIDYLGDILKPDIVIVTNILHAHIGNFPNRLAIAHAKSEIIPHLVSGGALFLPQDIFGKEIFLQQLEAGVVHYPILQEITASYTWAGMEGVRDNFSVIWKDDQGNQIQAKGLFLFSEEYLSIILAVANFCDISRKDIFENFKKLKEPAVESRLQVINSSKALLIDDSYNANPDSMEKVIKWIIEIILPKLKTGEKLFIVLGDILELGDKSEYFHRQLANTINLFLKQFLNKYSSEEKKLEVINRVEFFFLGSKVKLCYDIILVKNKFFFTEISELCQSLSTQIDSKSIVFFKASNGMNFKKIIKNLI